MRKVSRFLVHTVSLPAGHGAASASADAAAGDDAAVHDAHDVVTSHVVEASATPAEALAAVLATTVDQLVFNDVTFPSVSHLASHLASHLVVLAQIDFIEASCFLSFSVTICYLVLPSFT